MKTILATFAIALSLTGMAHATGFMNGSLRQGGMLQGTFRQGPMIQGAQVRGTNEAPAAIMSSDLVTVEMPR